VRWLWSLLTLCASCVCTVVTRTPVLRILASRVIAVSVAGQRGMVSLFSVYGTGAGSIVKIARLALHGSFATQTSLTAVTCVGCAVYGFSRSDPAGYGKPHAWPWALGDGTNAVHVYSRRFLIEKVTDVERKRGVRRERVECICMAETERSISRVCAALHVRLRPVPAVSS
jgi:hypothetical protein